MPGLDEYLHDGLKIFQQLCSVAMVPIGPRRMVPNHNLPWRHGRMQLFFEAPQLRAPVLAGEAACTQQRRIVIRDSNGTLPISSAEVTAA